MTRRDTERPDGQDERWGEREPREQSADAVGAKRVNHELQPDGDDATDAREAADGVEHHNAGGT